MNTYFLNVASKLVNMLSAAPKIFSCNSFLFKNYYLEKIDPQNHFAIQHVTEQFVNLEISRLNPNKSCGIDGINAGS